jgi:hypothetical protein
MSHDLTAARELLDELDVATRAGDTDSQTTAITAAAHSILVLAEQVAVIRVVMVEEARLRRANGQWAPAPNGQPPAQVENGREPAAQAENAREPTAQTDHAHQPAPQGKQTRRKRGWW